MKDTMVVALAMAGSVAAFLAPVSRHMDVTQVRALVRVEGCGGWRRGGR